MCVCVCVCAFARMCTVFSWYYASSFCKKPSPCPGTQMAMMVTLHRDLVGHPFFFFALYDKKSSVRVLFLLNSSF